MKVGLIGLAGAGKDTFAVMLQEELKKKGYEFTIDRYAKPLKVLTSSVFGLTMEEVEDRVIKESPVKLDMDVVIDNVFNLLEFILEFDHEQMDKASELFFEHFVKDVYSPREFQQLLGTEVVRAVKEDAWVERLQKQSGKFIVPDVRFGNEDCDFNILIVRGITLIKPNHPSEHFAYDLEHDDAKRLKLTDITLLNAGSLDDLNELAKAASKLIISKL